MVYTLLTSKNLRLFIKVVIPMGLALSLFWYLYKDSISETLQLMAKVNYGWVILSLLLGIISHIIRAFRWKLLMEPTGYFPTLGRSLAALFAGYLANLVLPRLGEVSRCLALTKTDRIPVTTSFGTVVIERVLDALMLLMITGVAFIVEYEKLNGFFGQLFREKLSGMSFLIENMLYYGIASLSLMLVIWFIFRRRLKQTGWWKKLKSLALQTWSGLTSITRLQKQGHFWLATFGIWVLYFLMSYVVFYSMEPTQHLGWRAGIALLVMGGLGMSAPVQGGIGAYHLLVGGLLIYYGVEKSEGLSFAFLLHSSQTLMVLIAGLISVLIIFSFEKKMRNKSPDIPSPQIKNI